MDTEGLLLACHVHAADIQERAGAKRLPRQRAKALGFPARRRRLIWADRGYWGAPFAAWVRGRGRRVALAALCRHATLPNRKTPGQAHFVRPPRRWVVGRTFAWLGRWRRTSKDDERNPRSSETWLYLAMIGLMLRRLDPCLSIHPLSEVEGPPPPEAPLIPDGTPRWIRRLAAAGRMILRLRSG